MTKKKIDKKKLNRVKGGKKTFKNQFMTYLNSNEISEITTIGKRLLDNFFGKP